jgi:hypothetical protein
MAVPKVLPDWFYPLTRRKYGLTPTRPKAPRIIAGGQYQWVLDEWARFDKWTKWKTSGGPRPAGIWRAVPTWAWKLRAERAKQVHVDIVIEPGSWPFKAVPSKTAGRCGLYFYTYDNKPMDDATLISLCKQHNLWVALLTWELDRDPVPKYNTEAVRQRLQGQGITVVSSGWVEAEFDHQAQAVAAAQHSVGYDEVLINAEASWGYPAPGFSAMGSFAPKLRTAIGPNMPLSVSCLWGQQTWWKPLLEAGMSVVRPQPYMNEWPHQDVAECVARCGWSQSDLKGGIPAHMVEPTLGTYGAHLMSMTDYAGRVAAAIQLGARACSTWAAENLPVPEYPMLASFRR